MAIKYIAPALAVIGLASAQCSVSGTATLQNAGDATAYAACSTISGSVAIATGTTDAINLPNVRAITGDLVMQSAPNITSLGADSLEQIGGTFHLEDNQLLSTLTMPRLTQVNDLVFKGLPNLQALGFTSNLKYASSLDIENTFLTSLNGINLQRVNTVYITNNRLLQDISFQISSVRDSTVGLNGDRLSVAFPNLETARNMTFRSCPSISIPSLANVTGALGFYENSFSSLAAPNLTSVGGTLAIDSNNQLTNISMPMLKTIGGGFQVQNNSQLTDLSGSFPAVTTTGSIDFYGVFTSVELPALKDDKGAFNVQSTNDLVSDCNTFKAEAGSNKVIKGKYFCMGNLTQAGAAGTSGSASSNKTSEARSLDISSNAAIGIGSVIAAILGLL